VSTLPRSGAELHYEVQGDGALVVLVMGTGSPGRVWKLHQVPALVAAGYRVATFDARGIGRSAWPDAPNVPAMTIDDLVGDVAALIEHLSGGPVRVVGTSLGARVVQELALRRPELVRQAVMMAGHARLDPVQIRLTQGEQELYDRRLELPPAYLAAVTAVLNLSPATLGDEDTVRDWLDVFELSASPTTAGERAQLGLASQLADRREAYRAIRVPSLVIGFADDVMIPPYLSREVAGAIPGARYAEVSDAGHFGYLERPDEVNRLVLDFFAE
jgi:pimeloyl-ACP methyl ester carboxylesterase